MISLSTFKGHYFKAPYEIMNFSHLVETILEEILFYGSGYGWASSAGKIRNAEFDIPTPPFIKVAILLPYINQKPGETQDAYLQKLMLKVRKELCHYITTSGIGRVSYQAIDGFEYGVTRVAKDIHQFALVLKK